MKTLNVRFGEAYKVSMPSFKAEMVGHDGVDFKPVNLAPLQYNSIRWNMLQNILRTRGAGLVNAYDPLKQKKETYIITSGPKQDTFERVKYLQSQMASASGLSKKHEDIQTAMGMVLPLKSLGIITGDEPVIEMSENMTEQKEVLNKWGILPVRFDDVSPLTEIIVE